MEAASHINSVVPSPWNAFVTQRGTFKVRRTHGTGQQVLSCCVDFREGCTNNPPSSGWSVAVLCHGLFSDKDALPLTVTSAILRGTQIRSQPGRKGRDFQEEQTSGTEMSSPGRESERDYFALVDAVVRLDFHGNGESEGFAEWSLGGYDDDADDLRDVILFLRQHQNIHVNVLFGHSRAASSCLLYCVRFGCDIPIVIVASGRISTSGGLDKHMGPEKLVLLKDEKCEFVTIQDPFGRDRKVTPHCIHRRILLDIPNLLRSIRQEAKLRALLVVHGSNDSVVPLTDATATFDILVESPRRHEVGKADNQADGLRCVKVEGTEFVVGLAVVPGGGHSLSNTRAARKYRKLLYNFWKAHHLPSRALSADASSDQI